MFSYFIKNSLINILFSLIPLSFIAGNLILNLNILLLIVSAITFYGKGIFKINFCFLDKMILIFFSFTLITGIFNNINNYNLDNSSKDLLIIIKTLLYLRFLILYFILRYLIEKNIINFKIFFISSFFCAIFVSLDLMFQYLNGRDIFGYQGIPRRLSGPFGDELIAGSYLQRFTVFSFFLFPLFSKINNPKYLYLIFLLLFSLFFISMVMAGNRMPILLFLLIISLAFFLVIKKKKYFIIFLLIILINFLALYLISYKGDRSIYRHFGSFYLKIIEFKYVIAPSTFIPKEDKDPSTPRPSGYIAYPNTYIKEFNSGYVTWLQNKYIGGGIKSFKKNCKETGFLNCSPHPHNYYLEILSELGLIGFLLLSIIFFKIIYSYFIKKYLISSSLNRDRLTMPFILLFIAEIFPLKTSGSFFTTGNATYFFLILAITVALSERNKLN